MKPNFAFTLSYKGVCLLHRAFPGWAHVGEVPFDSPDLASDLADLRQKADDLATTGMHSKLVLPGDQIKYLKIPAVDDSQSTAESRVNTALVGATPYEVSDLAFDWSVEGDDIYIAAVARETLAEAESFANEHSFNPVCFVAIPDPGTFSGEPFFGKTQYAATVLADGETVTRDIASIVVLATTTPPPVAADRPPTAEPVEAAQEAAPVVTDTDNTDHDINGAMAEPENDVSVQTTGTEAEPVLADEIGVEDKPAPEIAAFSSIRARREDGPANAPRLEGVARNAATTIEDAIAPPTVVQASAPAPPIEAYNTPERKKSEDVPNATAPAPSPSPSPSPAPAPSPEPVQDITNAQMPAPKGTFISRRLPNIGRPSLKFPSRAARGATTAVKRLPEPKEEKQRMTVFGARQTEVVGGKPRFLGLILTAVLLLFLAGVAAWASVFLGDGLAGLFSPNAKSTAIASAPSDEDHDALTQELAIEGDEALAPGPILASLPSTITNGGPGAAFEPAISVPIEIDPVQAMADYAVTGIWQLAPPQPASPPADGLESLYITSIDPKIPAADAVALPDPRHAFTDIPLRAQISPISPEIEFNFDARGLVVATATGAFTPGGFIVFLGRPIAVPPKRPLQTIQSPEDTAENLRLAGRRPNARPANLVEQNERSTLGGRTREEMARLRPTARPRIAEEKRVEETNETATAQAVTTSRKPTPRPGNFARIVQRAQKEQREQVTAVAAVAPRTVVPKVPSTAGVARLATTRKAINLRRINLIGVYGKPSSRRALVRLPNGRYKKVKVGDRIDGGRISAIGDSDLRYNKGGRNVVLKMPRG